MRRVPLYVLLFELDSHDHREIINMPHKNLVSNQLW